VNEVYLLHGSHSAFRFLPDEKLNDAILAELFDTDTVGVCFFVTEPPHFLNLGFPYMTIIR
jgi:hypothetical protein